SEVLPTVVLEDEEGSDPIVVGKEFAHARNEQVEVAVAVQIRRRGVHGTAHVARDDDLFKATSRKLAQPDDLVVLRLTGDRVLASVPIEFDGDQVADPRMMPRVQPSDAFVAEAVELFGRHRCGCSFRTCWCGRVAAAGNAKRECRDNEWQDTIGLAGHGCGVGGSSPNFSW